MAQQRGGPAAYVLLLAVLCASCLFISSPAELDRPAGKRSALAAVTKDVIGAPAIAKRLGNDDLDATVGPLGDLGVALLVVLAAASTAMLGIGRRRLRGFASRAPPHRRTVRS